MSIRIENVTLYNGHKEKREHTSLLFDETAILAIGDQALSVDADVVIDGTGMTCLPGFIDLHVHLSMDGSPDTIKQMVNDSETLAAYRSLNNAQKQLASGVVTIRTCGCKYNEDIELRKAIHEGVVKGPRIYASGRPIGMTGGHCHMFGIEADGVDSVRKAARNQLKAGADLIKLMATGGGLTPGVKAGSPQLLEEELAAACQEAKHAGKRTAAHAQGCEGIKNAIRAGITTIEHGVELDEEAIQLMLESGTYLIATLAAPYHVVKNGVSAGIPEYVVRKNEEAMIPHRISFQRANRSGVKIATGTDAGTPFNLHGDFATELELMVEQGMSVQEVIGAATYTGAEALGIEKETGSVEVGKWADLILLEGDPELDITSFRKVKRVYKEGICFL